MALIRQSAADLLVDANSGRLHQRLEEQATFQWQHRVGTSEVRSWQRSLPPFLADLFDAGLGHVEVLLEHRLPHSPKRVDVVLCGIHPRTAEPTYVLVELKQWSRAELLAAELVALDAYSEPVIHPVTQVQLYCEHLVGETPALAERPYSVHGIAYLHNANDSGVRTLKQYTPHQFGRLYTMDDKAAMLDHLRSLLSPEGDRTAALKAADDFTTFHHAPSKPLLNLAAREIREREQFVLLDEQRVAFDLVMRAVERARTARKQTVVVVRGGPGSGKSVIALSLLGELARRGRPVHHATGSSAFTNTMRKVAGAGDRQVKNLFKYFNNYSESEPRTLDVLICDEAHRIRETSVNRFTRKAVRDSARPQITELIDVAWVPVFLLDENQTVRPGEMGSLAEIRDAATAAGCDVETVTLEGQFRCGGSAVYDTWVERLLGIDKQSPIRWKLLAEPMDDDFVVTTADSPDAVESWLLNMRGDRSETARVAAGFCWRWSNPVAVDGNKTLVPDVKIGSWERPWNAKPNTRVPDAPESYYWASDDRGFNQVGCIYTAQGFEYDWAGVLFGPDFVRRDDKWVALREESHDPAVKKAGEFEFPALIRNTYKVLLTRGMRGVCLYSTDAETHEFLRSMTR
ncbi:ATP-binding protein [Amycolatopsis antarctica]|uniref:ATP-binding protein n=1 Tax=Amycolatopsis antarctica TaxID=1854586 RepID=A0A263D6S4_9PSEU|nr:DUF2075 domain-containing protein [Amycolatopsis antarctica]OZM73176.1 ATP-binding protein [Amycolatopsis antarctica]